MMDNILVTVILATYDRPNDLRRALKSVVSQTYKNLEILIVDGKGLKEIHKIIRAFKDNRINYLPCFGGEKTSALYGSVQRARNIGLTCAHGKYVAMLDDDDYWKSRKIEKQLFYAEVNNGALVSCYMKIRDSSFVYADKPLRSPKYEDLLRSFNMSCTSSFFLNRKILQSIGGFDESLRSMHEYDIALKLAKRGYVIYVVPEILMTMVRNNSKNRKFYYIKVAEILDLYRFYGKDMLIYLGIKGLIFNVIKSSLLIALFLMGYIFKEKIWQVVFRLKSMYQENKNALQG